MFNNKEISQLQDLVNRQIEWILRLEKRVEKLEKEINKDKNENYPFTGF